MGVAYSEQTQQIWLTAEDPDDTTMLAAIEKSGVLKMFPAIDPEIQNDGVIGRLVKLDSILKPGDRVKIYRPITCDPQTVLRRDGIGADDDE